MNTIVIEQLHKSFKEKKVLNDLTLSCHSGKIYGFVGYNGSGKTVLFKCICGFIKPDKGNIYIMGKKQGHLKFSTDNIGIIIEEPAFLKNKSGFKNLEYLYNINHKPNKSHMYDILKLVGLDEKDRKRVEKYSLGMKQRLAIAQAIMENPDILILDEPMNGLDKKGVVEIRSLILNLKEEGKTILLASHNKEDINILCDEVYEIENGSLNKL
ncbi:ABC-2 type transport system ATP-binding protein [Lachnotalea glycerini]|uniref:ABC-2 type transport system ATP-binding protein n=1 Tax=Lachnotalea glycerini TaxID=1763509 RepID=A0A255I7H3_9FIRM|nr:ATP-binding cassette domain-containing protein [Lachnotalea glycerini]PXV96096.1 ABC-2 type transport system ATP-binding protein [Lachnotalea glycerini]RDY29074.1 ATP-binding cassette domain-containing protein [Lachnotalea glycerini]